jgi:PAS domain S-box-containing protein
MQTPKASSASSASPDLLFRAIVEQAPDAMIYADREGLIRIWNAAAEKVFGHTAAEAVGASLDIIIPERFRAAHWDGFNKAVASGVVRHQGRAMTTRSMRKDGSKLYLEVSFGLVRDAAGTVIGSLAIGREQGNSGQQPSAPASVPKGT